MLRFTVRAGISLLGSEPPQQDLKKPYFTLFESAPTLEYTASQLTTMQEYLKQAQDYCTGRFEGVAKEYDRRVDADQPALKKLNVTEEERHKMGQEAITKDTLQEGEGDSREHRDLGPGIMGGIEEPPDLADVALFSSQGCAGDCSLRANGSGKPTRGPGLCSKAEVPRARSGMLSASDLTNHLACHATSLDHAVAVWASARCRQNTKAAPEHRIVRTNSN
jgi:hypothetical protein